MYNVHAALVILCCYVVFFFSDPRLFEILLGTELPMCFEFELIAVSYM